MNPTWMHELLGKERDAVDKVMIQVEHMADQFSNCNSRGIGCMIYDADDILVSYGYNNTAAPICLFGVCEKRWRGDAKGHSPFCKATHAESMAAQMLIYRVKAKHDVGKAPYTAIMNCGPPCAGCLYMLHKAGVKTLYCNKGDFYTYPDEIAWNENYHTEMELYVYDRGD
jgi:deoxycytidylate deaminase